MLLSVAAVFGTGYGAGWLDYLWMGEPITTASGGALAEANFSFCHNSGGHKCVVDGDTLVEEGLARWYKGVGDLRADQLGEREAKGEMCED